MNRPVASVRPMMSTPVPMQPAANTPMLRPGVSVQQVKTTTGKLGSYIGILWGRDSREIVFEQITMQHNIPLPSEFRPEALIIMLC